MMQDEQEVLFKDLTAERDIVMDKTNRMVVEREVALEDFVQHSE